MTKSKPKWRVWWIVRGDDGDSYFCESKEEADCAQDTNKANDVPFETLHVIEYTALEEAEREIAELKQTLEDSHIGDVAWLKRCEIAENDRNEARLECERLKNENVSLDGELMNLSGDDNLAERILSWAKERDEARLEWDMLKHSYDDLHAYMEKQSAKLATAEAALEHISIKNPSKFAVTEAADMAVEFNNEAKDALAKIRGT